MPSNKQATNANIQACFNGPNSNDECRNRAKCAFVYQGAQCGAPDDNIQAVISDFLPDSYAPCKNLKTAQMKNPGTWTEQTCQSCMLISTQVALRIS